jgi:peptide/nickel transport system ATP-binding protein
VIARNVQRMLVMYGGTAIEQGDSAAVLQRPAHPYTRGLLAARPRLGAAREHRLQTIPGRVPELVDLPAGCPFAQRCNWHLAACDAQVPPDETVAPGHQVRCVRWAELATGAVSKEPA